LRSNPGLELANAFGVIVACAPTPGLELANAFGVIVACAPTLGWN